MSSVGPSSKRCRACRNPSQKGVFQQNQLGSFLPVSVLTIDTLRQVAAGKAQRLETGGPSREVENGRALARFFVPDWSCELRYRLLPSDKTVAVSKKVLLICSHLRQFSKIIPPPNHPIPVTR